MEKLKVIRSSGCQEATAKDAKDVDDSSGISSSCASRRKFLKRGTLALAGMASLRLDEAALAAAFPSSAQKERHVPMPLSGVHGYPSQESVAAGQFIEFHLSASVPYQLSIYRLGHAIDDPSGDELIKAFELSPAVPQPIYPGSYAHVTKRLPSRLKSLTLECWLRPWAINNWAGLITQYDHQIGGLGLFVAPEGALGFFVGDKKSGRMLLSPKGVLKKNEWFHLAATWNRERKQIWVNGHLQADEIQPGLKLEGLDQTALRLAAYGEKGLASHFLDGDLAMPAIYDCALTAAQIQERHRMQTAAGGIQPPDKKKHLLACWPLDEERGELLRDISSSRRQGRIVNHATWMIGGPCFQPEVARFGDYDPKTDPLRGHGLRFSKDDLYDCGWPARHRFRVPLAAKPGFHVGRIRYQLEGKDYLYHITFNVRRAARRKKPPILVLASTNTWRAYSGTPFALPSQELKQVWGTGGFKNPPENPPAHCFYRPHSGGQGTYQLGLKMPWPVAGPYILYGGKTNYSHLMRAERFAHVWLEKVPYDFDVITDQDLHRDPAVLLDYRILMINGHSEYWSIDMYRGLEKFLKNQGNLIVLSGNSLFWRVSFDDERTVLECRKVDAPGDQLPPARRGECWHSQDGLRGGLLRDCGYPGWKLIGLETLGWNNQDNPAQFGPYLVDDPSHFLFREPFPVNIQKGEAIGQAPDGRLPRANGHEIDVRLSTLAALQKEPTPPGAPTPVDPPGMTRLANGIITWKLGGAAFDYFFRPVKPATDQGGEMIYWERPDGGRVFNAGSIGAGWGLAADSKFQTLMKNVLHHFGASAPAPAAAGSG